MFCLAGAIAASGCDPGAAQLAPSGPDSSEQSDDQVPDGYFAPDHVLDVAIELDPTDWDTLRVQARSFADILGGDCLDGPPDDIFTFFPASVTVDGDSLEDVGIRKKGFLGSLSDKKPALKLRFDRYVEDQLMGGELQSMTLNNVQQDGSKLNTCLSYAAFADAGLPSPRCNFATVSVNGEDLGLYVHVESIKRDMLERHFSNLDGSLYEGTVSDFSPVWRNTFQPKTDGDPDGGAAIDALVDALGDPSPAGLEAIESLVDIDRFLTFWAMEVIVGHWDGYSGNRNNFYLYREPDGRFVFMPWGADSSFAPIEHRFDDEDYPQSVMARAALPHRLYLDEAYQAAYVERLEELLDTVWDESHILDEVDRMAGIVQDHALPYAQDIAEYDTERVRDFVENRREQVESELQPEPPEWHWPLSGPDICWEVLGGVDVGFETTWGSLGSEPFVDEGSLDIDFYMVDGQTLSFGANGATAGIEANGEAAGAGVVTLGNEGADGTWDALLVYMDPSRIVSGNTVRLDEFTATGYRVLFPPPYVELEYVARIGSGTVEFDEASTVDGAPVVGRLRATLYGFGGYESGSGAAGSATDDSGVVINEVAARGEPGDWFELYNGSDDNVDLSAFTFADNLWDASRRTAFAEGTTIAAGEHLVVGVDSDGWPGFALGGGEELGVWNAWGFPVDSVNWRSGQSDAGTSYARVPDASGPFATVSSPSPGAPND